MLMELMGWVGLVGYAYVGIMTGLMQSKSGKGMTQAALAGATWPLTIYPCITSLYETKPD